MTKYNTRLHHCLPIAGQKHNRYCGPGAIAAITGVSTGVAAKMLREVTGKASIKGTSTESVLDVLGMCGFRSLESESYYPYKSMTLRRWLAEHYTGRLALVEAMNHWFAFADGYFCDTFNKLPTPNDKVHNPKSQVSNVYYLD